MQHSQIGGLIVNDPELKTTANGKNICSFTVALPSGTGNYKRTDFMNCVAFGATGENIAKYYKGKDYIMCEGEMQNSPYAKYTGSNGKQYDVPNWQFIVRSFNFLPKSILKVREVEEPVFVPAEEVVADVASQIGDLNDFQDLSNPDAVADGLPF